MVPCGVYSPVQIFEIESKSMKMCFDYLLSRVNVNTQF